MLMNTMRKLGAKISFGLIENYIANSKKFLNATWSQNIPNKYYFFTDYEN